MTADERYVACGAVMLVCLAVSAGAVRARWAPRLWVTLPVGLAARGVVAYLAYGHTPHDVGIYFHNAGLDVLRGRDPITTLHRYQWNFLPFMPYVFAAELKTGLSWEAASKLAPIICDMANVVLVGLLVRPQDRSGRGPDRARLLYALSPIAIMVAAWHGQVEPEAITLGLAALLLARARRAGTAGGAVGLAVAAKTWPVLFVPGVLTALPFRKWAIALAAAGSMVVVWLIVAVTALHDHPRRVLHILLGYRSFAGAWGWSGLLRYAHVMKAGYAGPHIDTVQRISSVVTAVALIAAVALFRRCTPEDLTAALLLVFIGVTAGGAVQYLLWPVPFLCVAGRRRPAGLLYMLLGTVYAGLFYLRAYPPNQITFGWPALVLQIFSIAIELAALMALPWRERAGLRPSLREAV